MRRGKPFRVGYASNANRLNQSTMKQNIEIRFKKLSPDAQTPSRANATDAGFDLTAIGWRVSDDHTYIEYSTGIAVEMPENYVGLIFPRSSISRVQQMLSNSVGVVDSGYRGEICFRFRQTWRGGHFEPNVYKVGEKIGQIVFMPLPAVELVEVEELSNSDRGEGGFGSSGK